jgi:transposase
MCWCALIAFSTCRGCTGEVADCYCCDDGLPGIDPEVAVRLMLAGLLTGIVHDRKLMREAHVNIAIRWFADYALHEKLPDHSSLTRIRQRWGEERFRKIFKRTVKACLNAKIVTAEVVHIDASLIRANVSWDSLVERHVGEVLSENQSEEEIEDEKKGRQSSKYKKVCERSQPTAPRPRRQQQQNGAIDHSRHVKAAPPSAEHSCDRRVQSTPSRKPGTCAAAPCALSGLETASTTAQARLPNPIMCSSWSALQKPTTHESQKK